MHIDRKPERPRKLEHPSEAGLLNLRLRIGRRETLRVRFLAGSSGPPQNTFACIVVVQADLADRYDFLIIFHHLTKRLHILIAQMITVVRMEAHCRINLRIALRECKRRATRR